jgi:hypothetical protein
VALGIRLGLVELGVPPVLRVVVTASALFALYAALAYVGSDALRGEMKNAFARVRAMRAR